MQKEAEGDNSCDCSGTLPEDQLKTHANLMSFSFFVLLLSHSPAATDVFLLYTAATHMVGRCARL